MTPLDAAIIDTLTYHGLFDFPLTAHETYLTMPSMDGATQGAVLSALDALKNGGLVGCRDGLWHLAGRESDVDARKARYDLAERKFRIARRFFRVARHAPFLRAVYVCNTLARSNARPESDIDLFVVTAPGRIWTSRLFVTGLAKLLGARPDRVTSKDRLCLSFFSTEDALDLRAHAIERDVYLPHWLFDLYPVYDESGVSGKLFAANAWARDRISGLRRQLPSARRTVPGGKSRAKTWAERLFGHAGFERLAKALQLRLMPAALKESARRGDGVVIDDRTLKLHGLDRRAEIRDRFDGATRAHEETLMEDYARIA